MALFSSENFILYLREKNFLKAEDISLILEQAKNSSLKVAVTSHSSLSVEQYNQQLQMFLETINVNLNSDQNLRKETFLQNVQHLVEQQKPDVLSGDTLLGNATEESHVFQTRSIDVSSPSKLLKNRISTEGLSRNELEYRYEVIENLGEGGMGVVQRVQDRLLGREVALKKIKPQHSQVLTKKQQMMLWRLQTEASITAILEHPNIVPLYDLQKAEDGEFYFTMRKIEGQTFKYLLKKQPSQSLLSAQNQTLSILLKVCDAISYAHSHGIIHRDLKPDNIMVGAFGEVYVMDWGIAKRLQNDKKAKVLENNLRTVEFFANAPTDLPQENNDPKTKLILELDSNLPLAQENFQTMGGIGTPGYMPPEQAKKASEVSIQSDIYALGVILKECFTGLSPYDEFQLRLKFFQQLSHKKQHLKIKKNDFNEQKIPEDILAIIKKATDIKAENRYLSVQDFAQDITRYLQNMRVSVRDYNALEIFQKWYQRNRPKVLILVVIVIICLFFPFYFYRQKQQEQEQSFQESMQLGLTKYAEYEQLTQAKILDPKLKIQNLLDALNALNNALQIKPYEQNTEEKKKTVGLTLIERCIESEDYQLANYVAKNLKGLRVLPEKEYLQLLQQLEEKQTKVLKEHQARLEYWISKLESGKMERGEKELAELEISKMSEKEIFNRLLQILEESNRYYLEQKERNSHKEFLYKVIINALGRIENPEAGPILYRAIENISPEILENKHLSEGKRRLLEEYLLHLTDALALSQAKGYSQPLNILREKMGLGSYFWQNSSTAYRLMAIRDQLQNELVEDANGLFNLGTLQFEDKKFTEAVNSFTKALDLDPYSSKSYCGRGNSYSQLQEHEKAYQDCQRALELDPYLSAAFHPLVLSASLLKKQNEILEQLNQHIENHPHPAFAYNLRGVLKMSLGDSVGAKADFTTSIELDSNLFYPYSNRAHIKSREKDFEGAIEDANKSIELAPKHIESYQTRSRIYTQNGNLSLAIKDYNTILEIQPDNAQFYILRGDLKQKARDMAGAIADYNEASRYEPQNIQVHFSLAQLKVSQGNLMGAIQEYTKALQKNPNSKEAYNHRGGTYFELQQWDKAIQDFDEIIRQNLADADVYRCRGMCKLVKKDFEGALNDFNESLRLDPNVSEVYHRRGHVRAQLKDIEGAISDHDASIRLAPEETMLYYCRATLYQQIKNYEEALKNYQFAIDRAPDNPTYFHNRGHLREELHDLEGAIADHDETLRLLKKSHPEVFLCRARLRQKAQDYKGALEDCDQFLRANFMNSEAYLFRASIKELLDDFSGALADYNKAIFFSPRSAIAYSTRGFYYLKQKNNALALKDFDMAIVLEPQFLQSYFGRGLITCAENGWEKAVIDFSKVFSSEISTEEQLHYQKQMFHFFYESLPNTNPDELEKGVQFLLQQVNLDDTLYKKTQQLLEEIQIRKKSE